MELRGCVELRGFGCETEGFWGLKRCGPCVELMYGTERVCVELRGTREYTRLKVIFRQTWYVH